MTLREAAEALLQVWDTVGHTSKCGCDACDAMVEVRKALAQPSDEAALAEARAEVERLREALEEMLRTHEHGQWWGDFDALVNARERARAALAGGKP